MNNNLPLDSIKVLNTLTTVILLVDTHLTVHYANFAAQQLLAQSARRLYGTPLTEVVNYLSLDRHLMMDSLSASQVFIDNEVTLVLEGQAHIMTLTAQIIETDIILLELTPMDSQRRLSQEQLQQAQQQAARDLVRGLAHEIKNPLGGLRGAAQLLDKALPDPKLHEYTRMIIEQADRLRNLVDRLLGPQYPGQRVTRNIHQALEQVYQLVTLESEQQHIKIIRDYDPSLPDLPHDTEQIQQVVLNLVRNAQQALTTQGGGQIILRTRTAFQVSLHGEPYRLVGRIDIEDNGPGIPIQLHDTLFYPMVSGRQGGTGLGLSIAYRLIDQHRGKIEFNSWPGHTLFSFYLPIRK